MINKITSRIDVSWTHSLPFYFKPFLTQWIKAILSKGCKPDNFEPYNSLRLSLTNIWGLRSNFVECESSLESDSPDILAPYETNLDDLIDCGNLSVRGYLPLIRKDSFNQMHSLAVYVKEGLPFAWDLSLKHFVDSYLCFWLALLHSVIYPRLLTEFDKLRSFGISGHIFGLIAFLSNKRLRVVLDGKS